MTTTEPDFRALEHITLTRDRRTGLVVALGGAEEAAGILQRNGFLDAPGPRGPYHRLPHGLPDDQQRRKATAASHALLATGHSVHLDPALNSFTAPNADREATLRYLTQLSQRGQHASSGEETAAVPTEIAGPDQGLVPLLREALVSTCLTWSRNLSSSGQDTAAAEQLASTALALYGAADQILLARNRAARTPPSGPAAPPAPGAGPASASSRHR
ncbi:hypothetical protein J7I94_02015 [Streptomyces sp. ISL-12]|uniref:hypothetical protein n=1 Tax=Streptomyces sp. ISL-12 TaxID=2819177 RepID=UPI001BEA2DA1|nr:hypothetical protein [Streptomyces sp. ISL-12]MBT2409347.1 hypothetical protein [Streptomyces sp. ISL-12]